MEGDKLQRNDDGEREQRITVQIFSQKLIRGKIVILCEYSTPGVAGSKSIVALTPPLHLAKCIMIK